MIRDAQVRACLTTKQLSVLSEQATVHPADGSPDALRAAQIVEAQIAQLRGGWGRIVAGALDALVWGVAVGEYVWADDGTLAQIAWHDPRRVQLWADAYGSVEYVTVRDAPDVRFPASRFVLYAHNARWGRAWGDGDLGAAYEPWQRKQMLNRMWLSALDRFGTPPVVGKFPSVWRQEEADRLAHQLANLQTESAITVPDGVEVTFENPRVEPGAGFEQAITYQDRQIARALLGQELTTQTGQGASHALGKVHQSVADDWVQSLRSEIAETVLTHGVARAIIATMLGENYAATVTPRVAFPNLSPDELAARASLIETLIRGDVVAPAEGWIRSFLGVPERQEKDEG